MLGGEGNTAEHFAGIFGAAAGGVAAVLGGEGYIILKGLDSQLVSIYTADGKQIYFNKVENECEEVSIEAGVYVVKYGKETKKVITKIAVPTDLCSFASPRRAYLSK